MTFGERLKKIREKYELTSNEFAKIVGIHPVTIRKYETNKMKPSKEHIDKMCSGMRLDRMVFEGIPRQYTNYDFRGDFYQQLFLMMSNGTLTLNDPDDSDVYFSLNPKLSKYLIIRNGDEEIPLENLHLEILSGDNRGRKYDFEFLLYLMHRKSIDEALSKRWNEKARGETIEKYIARLEGQMEETQLDVMLLDHSWTEFMAGMGTPEEREAVYQKVMAAGGNYYDYVDQFDIPDSYKDRLISEYEDLRILELCNEPTSPEDAYDPDTRKLDEKKFEKWYSHRNEVIADYKKKHPNYHMHLSPDQTGKAE